MTAAVLRSQLEAHDFLRMRFLILVMLVAVALFAAGDAWSQETFDHFSTGFQLDGAHANVTCEACHTGGSFTNTSPACVSCHSIGGLTHASAKPVDHVLSNDFCADCHTTAAWVPAGFMEHASVTGSCASCHNGTTATGKIPAHISSGDTCDDCHTTIAWLPASFDHSGIAGNCISCHNGTTATGKNLAHIQTSDVCEDCHSNTLWIPATTVDHTQVGVC
jgi:predicted CXXCH cytochrome family protein